MKINQNRPDTQKVPVSVINTMLEQISDLQEDTAELDARIDQLGTNVDTVSVSADSVGTNTLTVRNEASIDDLTVQGVTAQNINASGISASDGNITNIVANTVTSASETVESLTAANVGIQQLEAVNGQIVNLESTDIETNQLDANTIHTNGINNSGNYTGKNVNAENVAASKTVSAKDLNVSGNSEVNNLKVNGSLTGVSDIVADSIIIEETKSEVAQIDEIKNRITYTDTLHPITPSPSLDNNDTYTIELPQFTGTFILRWFYDNAERWSATVIGSGKNYAITFASHYEDVGYVLKLFQWDNKLYIRHNANGVLYYSCNTDKKPDDINIYYNMVGWANPKSLEELCDETHEIDIIRPSGTVMLGAVTVPMLETFNDTFGITFKGSCTFAEMPSLDDAMVGDVWNVTTEGYTDSDFIEGSSKPINAGDDIIAILDKSDPENHVLKWDKFAAGVNYDNFQAYDITATHALKSEGTLEVEGNTVLHNTTVTGNITQTGNQNVTGNETIIGKVTIGDLD